MCLFRLIQSGLKPILFKNYILTLKGMSKKNELSETIAAGYPLQLPLLGGGSRTLFQALKVLEYFIILAFY